MASSKKPKSKILVVDDHPIVRSGLISRINSEPGFHVCAEADSIASAMHVLADIQPDAAIVDVSLQDGNGIDLVRRIKSKQPQINVLVWSMFEESLYAERALRAGALGYVNKTEPTDRLIEVLRSVCEGKLTVSQTLNDRLLREDIGGKHPEETPISTLSERELDVFRRIGNGHSTTQIATELHISPKTVETYRDRIRAKLNINGGPELTRVAVLWVLENG